jgi:Na+-transporting methylmalonyl-CoA/oxaloacetate decarboxylase beta subunit
MFPLIAVAALSYLGLLMLFRVPESRALVDLVRRKLKRR